MESYKFIAGFSEIKVEFRTKTKTLKTIDELKLWFSFEDDVLYVHDYADHEQSLVLAIFNSQKKTWSIMVKCAYGRRLIEWIISQTDLNTLADEINEKYELCGFLPTRAR